MTFEKNSFPRLFSKIDELTRLDHSFLSEDASCFFLGEYTARAGFSHSATNQLIQNFKKPMDRRNTGQWYWKEKAIRDAASALGAAFGNSDLSGFIFVPIPPSKIKTDPMYDDRIMQMLNLVRPGLDIREIVLQIGNRSAAHDSEERPRPDEMAANYTLDEALCVPDPTNIIICDDVITTGCQFMAVKTVLLNRFPAANIHGVFLARRVPAGPAFDFAELDF